MLGTLGVTLRMYLIPFRSKFSRSAEFLASPRYRWGRTSTGKQLSGGEGGSQSAHPSSEPWSPPGPSSPPWAGTVGDREEQGADRRR